MRLSQQNIFIKDFIRGAKKALPIVLGYIPLAFAYGVLARQVGLVPYYIVLMSILVFAGSAQFIAVTMLGSGVDGFTIIFTTFLVNLRHLLMSASLSTHFVKIKRLFLPIISFGITDETFALLSPALAQKQEPSSFVIGVNYTSFFGWVFGSLLGAIFGEMLTGLAGMGLEFALYAMFIFLLIIQLENKLSCLLAIFSSMLALVLFKFLPGQWYIIITTLAGATLGAVIDNGK